MKKNILKTVSGGYDSTYLLIKNLKNENEVYPMYVFTSIDSIKQKIEYSVIQSLVKKLKNKYKNLHDLTKIDITFYAIKNVFSVQPFTWIIALFKTIQKEQFSIRFDEAQIGYIKSDCAIRYLPAIRTMWKTLFAFSNISNNIPKLCFPLSKYSKKYIINKLKDYDKNILALCWTCEHPKITKTNQIKNNSVEFLVEACGYCTPCDNLKETNKILFNNIKKYKVIFNYNECLNKFKVYINNLVKNNKISYVEPGLISLEYANKKSTNNS